MLVYVIIALLVVLVVLVLLLLLRPSSSREVAEENARTRKELSDNLERYRGSMETQLKDLNLRLDASSGKNRQELLGMMEQYRTSVSRLEEQVAKGMEAIRSDNEKRITGLQQSVDLRLRTSLATSFSTVTSQLEKVYEGLGRVKELSSGVDDLRRLMGNIKTRGTMGEVQAKSILDDILSPGQYDENVECKPRSGLRVEFAVRLPGGEEGEVVYLPIDCKFPREDYERIMDAQEKGDRDLLLLSRKQLEARIKSEAKDIATKYIDPPNTTAFALMFLASEGLYAEVLRIPGLMEELQRTWHVVVSGPTTLAAVLNSLGMGFRTLAIQKRSEEVWKLLAAVKTEFSRLGEEMDTAQKRMELVMKSFDGVSKRTQIMGRKLKGVEELDPDEAQRMLEG